MALNPIGVLDLSIVTKLLVDTIKNYWTTAPLWTTLDPSAFFLPKVTGLTPDAVRTDGGCQVTVSLIHLEPDKFNRNFVYPPPPQPPPANPSSPRAQAIPALPLSLDLYYFVSAFSLNSDLQEQQAMSIVLNCFHQNPALQTNVKFHGSPLESTLEQFTLTMEIESADSISRLWQAITVPFRLSVMYRVAVVLMTPPAAVVAKQVSRFGLAVEPASFPFATNGQVFGTSSLTTFISPDSSAGNPQNVSVDYSPATVVPGQRFFLHGAGLNQGTDFSGAPPNPGSSYRVYLLLPPDYKMEREVTVPWKAADRGSPNAPLQTSSRVVLDLPATQGALPNGAPPPGVYSLRVGSDVGSSDVITNRTNSTPFNVAARVDVPASPAIPILPELAGIYTITGMGFVPGSTEVLLETVALVYVALPPLSVGQFTVADVATITFRRPDTLPPGKYGVRVRVNGVESPPALWIEV